MPDHGIPVVVVSGGVQTGKTTFIRQLLQASRPASRGQVASSQAINVVVSSHESMLMPPGALHWPVQSTGASLRADCTCCGVQGDLVDALRNLFMQSLQRRIPAVACVIVELGASDDPALVMSTIRFDRFLGERFCYLGCVMVLGLGRAGIDPDALRTLSRQAALADIVLLDQDFGVKDSLQPVPNERAGVLTMNQLTDLDSLVERLTLLKRSGVRRVAEMGRRAPLFFAGQEGVGAAAETAEPTQGILCVSVYWIRPFSRKAFYHALKELTGQPQLPVLHVSGSVRFESAPGVFSVCVVHRQIYPFDQANEISDPNDPACCLAFMAYGYRQGEILDFINRFLPEGRIFV